MSPTQFRDQIAQLSAQLAGRPLDAHLDDWLNAQHGVGSTTYEELKKAAKPGPAKAGCVIAKAAAFATAAFSNPPQTYTASQSMWWT